MSDQTFGVFREPARKGDLLLKSHIEHLVGILMHEGRSSHNELVCKNSKSVPVCGATMTLVQDDLGRDVLWRATQSEGAFLDLHSLDESEVRQFDEAVLLDEYILWL